MTHPYFDNKPLARLKTTIRPAAAWRDIEADAASHLSMLKLPSPRGKILEIGCGIGRLLKPLDECGWDTTGIDSSVAMVAEAAKYAPACQVLLCDGTGEIPIDGESFDCVFSIITFQHIPHMNVVVKYLREAKRLLAEGGEMHLQFLAKTRRKGHLWTVHKHSAIMQILSEFAMNIEIRSGGVWRFYDCT